MKALITAGGFATRLFPATKAVPKAMLPLGGKPLIQHVVEELRDAGVDWIGVLCRGEQATIRSHFRTTARLVDTLQGEENRTLLADITRIDALARFEFLEFEQTQSFSEAMLLARSRVQGEPFILALSDEIDDPRCTTTVSKQLLAAYRRFGCTVVAYDRSLVPPDIAARRQPYRLARILDLERTPEDLFIVGRFLFAPDFLPELERIAGLGGHANYLAALDRLGERGRLVAMPFDGGWWHCGDRLRYEKAFIDFALADSRLGPEIREYILERISTEQKAAALN